MKLWRIYHRDREYAASVGDPLLGSVYATDKEAAEFAAAALGVNAPTGYWACEGAPSRATREPRAQAPASPAGLFTREGWIAGAERAARAHGLEPEDPRVRGMLRNALTGPWAQHAMLTEAAQEVIDVAAELRDESKVTVHEPGVRKCHADSECTICRFASAIVKLEHAARPGDSEG